MTHVSDPTDLDQDQPDAEPEIDLDPSGEIAAPAADPSVETVDPVATNHPGVAVPSTGFFARLGRRVIRRPMNWIDAPWTVQRVLRSATAFLFIVVAAIITKNIVHWDLVTTSNT